jgi:hypothetical protein
MGCADPPPENSELFQAVFLTEEKVFRGLSLGVSLDSVRTQEQGAPRHEDLLGLAYAYPLPDSQQLFVEYYTPPSESGQPQDAVQAIVANVVIRDPLRTAALYQEIQEHFRQKYGLSLGNYGNDRWEGEIRQGPIEVFLHLNGPRQGLTLNFIMKK